MPSIKSVIQYSTLIMAIALSACTRVSDSTRISYPLSASQYNGVYSNFFPRPTYLSLEKMSSGETVLAIEMNQYGNISSSEPSHQFRLLKQYIPNYLSLLDKYEAWRAQALSRGDAITQVIGRAPAWGQVSGMELEFTFHSGNASQHFLSIAHCAVGTCLAQSSLVFDNVNVAQLRLLLLKWQSGELEQLTVNSIYK